MDFYEKIIEINMQLADAIRELHSLNVFVAKKQFLSVVNKILPIANENKKDKKLYENLMNIVIFSLSNCGFERRELERLFGNLMPYKLLRNVTVKDEFSSKNKDFYQEFDSIFNYIAFVPKSETKERIRYLFSKYNMPYPLPPVESISA